MTMTFLVMVAEPMVFFWLVAVTVVVPMAFFVLAAVALKVENLWQCTHAIKKTVNIQHIF